MFDIEMTPSKTRVLPLAAALAVCSLCACSKSGDSRPEESGILMSMEEAIAGSPVVTLSGPVKVWAAEKSSDMGVYYVLSGREVLEPQTQSGSALRLILFKGRAELRVGDTVKVCDGGAYAVVPPGAAWRLKRLGKESLVFSMLVMPDVALSGIF